MARGAGATSVRSDGWSGWREGLALITTWRSLRRSLSVALLVGSTFFAMNQLPAILAGRAGFALWLKGLLTYLTPLVVSHIGMLSATHRRPPPATT